jgi:hypothetical protein
MPSTQIVFGTVTLTKSQSVLSPTPVFVGDIGTTFRLQVLGTDGDAVDLSYAQILQLIFTKPSGATLTITPGLATDGRDGTLQYTNQDANFLNLAGLWSFRAYFVTTEGRWNSPESSFEVAEL